MRPQPQNAIKDKEKKTRPPESMKRREERVHGQIALKTIQNNSLCAVINCSQHFTLEKIKKRTIKKKGGRLPTTPQCLSPPPTLIPGLTATTSVVRCRVWRRAHRGSWSHWWRNTDRNRRRGGDTPFRTLWRTQSLRHVAAPFPGGTVDAPRTAIRIEFCGDRAVEHERVQCNVHVPHAPRYRDVHGSAPLHEVQQAADADG